MKVVCQVKGEVVRDTTIGRTSSLWDRLSTGGYVANVYTTAFEAKKAGFSTGLTGCTGVTPTAPPNTAAPAGAVAVATTLAPGAAGPSVPSTKAGVVGARVLVPTSVA